MNVMELYRSKLISIEEAVSKVKSGQSIVTAMAAAQPPGLPCPGVPKGRAQRRDRHVLSAP